MRVVLVLLLAMACEPSRKDAPSPRPPPPGDATADVLVDRAAIETLDRLYTYVATTARTRSPLEPNEQLNNGYRELIFAYGYARAGHPQRVKELVTTAKSRLDDVIDDPIHTWIVDAYLARIADPGKRLPAMLDTQLAQRDRIERYKIDRLREVSRILNDEHVDAIGAFAKRSPDARGTSFESLRGVTDPAMRATILDQILESISAASEDRREEMLAGVLGECARLPPAHGAGVLERALAQIDHVPAHHHGVLVADAIVAAAAVAPDRVNALTSRAVPILAQGDRYALARALARLLRTVQNEIALGALWASVEKAGLDPQSPAHLRATYAAGLVALGDPTGKPIVAELERTLAGEMTMIERLDLIDALALAYAQMPAIERYPGIERLARQYPQITDSFGTNSHYTISLLRLYDILVVGVVE